MRTLLISDITLRTAAGNGETAPRFKESLEIARAVARLKPYALELPPLTGEKAAELMTKSVAAAAGESRVALPVGLSAEGVAAAFEAVKGAKHPVLTVSLPTSAVQMEYGCHKKPDKLLALLAELVAAAKALCPEVEFSAEDATRSERGFLAQAVETAIAAGATAVTLCDTAGTLLPGECTALIEDAYRRVPALGQVLLGVECSDGLHLAAACAVAAAAAGAGLIKTTVPANGFLPLSALMEILRARGVDLGLTTALIGTELTRIERQVDWVQNARRGDASPYEGGSRRQADGQVSLTRTSTQREVADGVKTLGYDLSPEDQANVYDAFRLIAEKKDVGSQELDAIVASAALQVPPAYVLDSYVINSGNVITATAHLKLTRNGKTLSGFGLGDGPIDASFLAIEQIVGHHYELDDFEIQAVTEGREAMGSALVRLRSGGKLYAGKGISTDVIGASIRAYMNALNKIVYEETRT